MTIEEHARIQTGLLLRRLTIQLNRAAKSCDEEAVHDLRVSIRRLNRCLRVFSEFYSDGSAKKVRRRLKTLMEAAGSVRDMDIAMEFLEEMGIGKRSPLVRRLAESRRAARRELEGEVRAWKQQGFSKKWRTTLGMNGKEGKTARRIGKPLQVEWTAGAEAAVNARTRLPELIAAYFAEGRQLIQRNPAPAELHALRLATKKVRYALELFRSCYDAGLEERISALKTSQQMLGEINDTVAGERTIEAALGARTPEMEKVARFLRRLGREKANKFKRHWTKVFDAPGQQVWWRNYLARPAGSSESKPARRSKTPEQEHRPAAASG